MQVHVICWKSVHLRLIFFPLLQQSKEIVKLEIFMKFDPLMLYH